MEKPSDAFAYLSNDIIFDVISVFDYVRGQRIHEYNRLLELEGPWSELCKSYKDVVLVCGPDKPQVALLKTNFCNQRVPAQSDEWINLTHIGEGTDYSLAEPYLNRVYGTVVFNNCHNVPSSFLRQFQNCITTLVWEFSDVLLPQEIDFMKRIIDAPYFRAFKLYAKGKHYHDAKQPHFPRLFDSLAAFAERPCLEYLLINDNYSDIEVPFEILEKAHRAWLNRKTFNVKQQSFSLHFKNLPEEESKLMEYFNFSNRKWAKTQRGGVLEHLELHPWDQGQQMKLNLAFTSVKCPTVLAVMTSIEQESLKW